jgi:hypothetical protein
VLLALDPASARRLALIGHLPQISGGSYLAASPATGSAVSCGSTPPRTARRPRRAGTLVRVVGPGGLSPVPA